MLIADPLQVKYYERKLKRKLTSHEIHGQMPIKLEGQDVYLELTMLEFPYAFMSYIDLVGLIGKTHKAMKD